jgi:hypothetical protein
MHQLEGICADSWNGVERRRYRASSASLTSCSQEERAGLLAHAWHDSWRQDTSRCALAVSDAALHEKGTKKLTNQVFAAEKSTKLKYGVLPQYHTWLQH